MKLVNHLPKSRLKTNNIMTFVNPFIIYILPQKQFLPIQMMPFITDFQRTFSFKRQKNNSI